MVTSYRQEVKELDVWCSLNNLELKTLKTVEMIVDFRRNPPALPPLTIMNSTVTAVESFRFLGTTISQDLKWDNHIVSIVKKAQQRLYFLRQLRTFNLPQELLKQFYSAIIESVLCTSVTVWFSSATKSDLRRLRRVVRTAERIIGTTLPTLQQLYLSRVSKKTGKITLDPSHPAHSLFELLPSGRRYRALSIYIYIYAFSRRFYPKRLTVHSGYTCFVTMCVPWESNPQPFALLTQCSTTEPQEHQNDQTQEQFIPSSNPSHEHLTLNVEHTTHNTIYIIYSSHIHIFHFNLHISDLYTHNCLYYILCFCYFVHCLFVYLYIILLLSVSCPVAVILLHCGASVTITNSSYV